MATAPPTRLTHELEVYESNKRAWLSDHRDEYVVMKASKLLGFFATFHEAYTAGVREFGIDTDFLVKRVTEHEPVFVIF